MTPERIEKAAQLNKLYAALASGEALQVFKTDTAQWWDITEREGGPNLHSALNWWRIKPNPQTFWIQRDSLGSVLHATNDALIADEWRKEGYRVTETLEVLP
jgi:hypothetical protein